MTSMVKGTLTHKLPFSTLIRAGLGLLFLLVTGTSGLLVFAKVREEVAASDILPAFTMENEHESPNVERPEGAALPVWTGTERVTVLFLGIDERVQQDDFWRSDTIILATVDPVTKKAGVLSIPRDLWVSIPGYGENRINTAHQLGDAYDYPGGGPALAVDTVQYNLGVEIDYYVRINFQAFIDLVDLIGGIEIDVPETIDDPLYPGPNNDYDPLYIEAGRHHFYGDMALKYARTRHTGSGDFDRMRRQQQVIRAILERLSEPSRLPQLAAQAPEIVQMVENSVAIDPNLQLNEILALAALAREIDTDDIRFRTIDETCTLFKTTPEGWQILVPLRDKIRDVRDEVFGLGASSDEMPTVLEEAATISVLNGTQTAGLAYSVSQYLETNGISVAAYDNADRQDYDTSLVILNRDKPMTALQILSLLRLPQSAVVNGNNPTAAYDIVVILGNDYVESTPGGW